MTKSIYLDPDKTAPLEPSEGDSRNGSWISSFDVPQTIRIRGDRHAVFSFTFDYLGGETGEERKSLDSRDDPAIQVRSGRITGKILELNFGKPISEDNLRAIGDRIAAQASSLIPISTKFNYQMIADIFRQWSRIVGPSV